MLTRGLTMVLALLAAGAARATTLPDGSVRWGLQVTNGSTVVEGSLTFAPVGAAISLQMSNPVSGVSVSQGVFGSGLISGGPAVSDGVTEDAWVGTVVNGVPLFQLLGFSLPTNYAAGSMTATFTLRDLDGLAFGSGGLGLVPPPSDPPPLSMFEVRTVGFDWFNNISGGLNSGPQHLEVQITALPEPESLWLLGLLALAALRARRAPHE